MTFFTTTVRTNKIMTTIAFTHDGAHLNVAGMNPPASASPYRIPLAVFVSRAHDRTDRDQDVAAAGIAWTSVEVGAEGSDRRVG